MLLSKADERPGMLTVNMYESKRKGDAIPLEIANSGKIQEAAVVKVKENNTR